MFSTPPLPGRDKKPWRAIALLSASLSCATTLPAQEVGQVPYAVIHKVVSRTQQVKHPKLRAVVRLESKAKGVKPRDLEIQARSGAITVPLGPNGEVNNFPITSELLKENPMVHSNLPKGSSQMNVALEIVVSDSLSYSYRELAQLLDDANSEIKKQAGMLSLMAPRAKGLSFEFRGGGRQTVTISRKEPQVLTTNSDGIARLEIDKSTAAQDPPVIVSEKPVRILVH